MNFMKRVLDTLIPRYITEDVCADGEVNNLTEAVLYFPVEYLKSGERYDLVVRVKSFNFFGTAYNPKIIAYQKFDDYLKENYK